MSLRLGEIILNTQSADHLSEFLSELFDCEIRKSDNGFLVLYEQFSFHIIPREIKFNQSPTQVHFFLDSEEELEQVFQKYQFILYKNKMAVLEAGTHIKKEDTRSYFEFLDVDKRVWTFSFNKNM